MTVFMLAAAAMLLAALSFIIFPLLRPSSKPASEQETLTVLADGVRELDAELARGTLGQAEYDASRRELERRALAADAALGERRHADTRAGWPVALAAGIALPLLAVIVYVGVGQPDALLAGNGGALARIDHERLDGAIDALSRRLAKDGNDGKGWVLLARSYVAANRPAEALGAYQKATALIPDNAGLLVEYADAQAVANNRILAGKPEALLERALKIDPDNRNALALAGAAALQGGNRTLALTYWTRLAGLLDPASADGKRIAAVLAMARGEATGAAAMGPVVGPKAPGAAPPPDAAAAGKAGTAAAGGAPISGTVTIAAKLADKVAPTDTLFIFAKAASGPPMPVAVMRTRAGAWPVEFKLDDSSAMVEGRALSKFPRVTIVARVSRSGHAISQPGDIEGHVENVAPGSSEVHVVLDHVVSR